MNKIRKILIRSAITHKENAVFKIPAPLWSAHEKKSNHKLNNKFILLFSLSLLFILGSVFASSVLGTSDVFATHPSPGSIRVCKVVLDASGNVVNGATSPSAMFNISGFTPSPVTSSGNPAGQIGLSTFITPLNFNGDVFFSVSGNDSECVSYSELALGGYYYEEEIYPTVGWEDPLYNDQFSHSVLSTSDFFIYSGELFDGDTSNDGSRNLNSDGHIVLTNSRPNRILVVLNQMKPFVYECPFTPAQDRTIIEFPESWRLRSDQTSRRILGPINASISSGNYDITLVSYDISHPAQGTQPEESWYLELYNSSSSVVLQSSPIGDLSNLNVFRTELVDAGIAVTGNSSSLKVFHAASLSAHTVNSIRPVCAAFDKLTPEPSSLTITKSVINDDGGTAVVSDFDLFVDTTQVTSGVALTLTPGTYAASEANLSGYTASVWGGDCSELGLVTLLEGDNKVCTITNDDIPAQEPETYTISGFKFHDSNKNGEFDENESILSDWTINLSGDAVNSTVTNESGNYLFTNLNVGSYIVCEVLQGGWVQSYPQNPGCHDVTLVASGASGLLFGNYTTGGGGGGGGPILTITKTVAQPITNPGATIDYIIVVRNNGNSLLANVVLADVLPAGFTYTETGLTTRSWSLGTIFASGSVTTTYQVDVSDDAAVGFYTNTATADADNHPPRSDDAVVEVRFTPPKGEEFFPVLLIEKTGDREIINPGGQINYTIKITNVGEAPAINLSIEDILPDGFTLASDDSSVINWTVGRLNINEFWNISFLVNISEDIAVIPPESPEVGEIEIGVYVNEVRASASNYDKELFSSYTVTARGRVLGETGVTSMAIAVWISALIIMIFSSIYLRKIFIPKRKSI